MLQKTLPAILYRTDEARPDCPVPIFVDEYRCELEAGFQVRFFGFQPLRAGKVEESIAFLADGAGETPILHRGLILTDAEYVVLHQSLCTKGYRPVIRPEAYNQSQYAPNTYPLICAETSGWTHGARVTAWS